MTRSEEALQVGKRREASKIRLRQYVVTVRKAESPAIGDRRGRAQAWGRSIAVERPASMRQRRWAWLVALVVMAVGACGCTDNAPPGADPRQSPPELDPP
jgi:hypothetical protein